MASNIPWPFSMALRRAFPTIRAAHPPVWPKAMPTSKMAQPALEVLHQEGFALIPAELRHRQLRLQQTAGNLTRDFQQLAGQGAERWRPSHLAAPGQQHQQPEQERPSQLPSAQGMEQTGSGGESSGP